VGNIVQALPDRLVYVGPGGGIEQSLVSRGVLNYSLRSASHGQHHRSLALFEVFDELSGIAAESGQRLDVFTYIEHGKFLSSIYSTEKDAHQARRASGVRDMEVAYGRFAFFVA
jgi:hypothetical protein